MHTQAEVFKDVAGYEGKYQVSNLGRIKSLARDKQWGNIGTRNIGDMMLRPIGKRYHMVRLYNGVQEPFLVHRLVATAFVPNPESLPFVNHIDGNIKNNSAMNLEWVTASQNSFHKYNILGYKQPSGEQNKRSHEFFVIDPGGNSFKFTGQKNAARTFGLDQSAIRMCLIGKRQQVNGYKFYYQ